VLRAGGWDPKEFKEYLNLLVDDMPADIQVRFQRENDPRLPLAARVLSYEASKHLWQLNRPQRSRETSHIWNQLLEPQDLADCTPYTVYRLNGTPNVQTESSLALVHHTHQLIIYKFQDTI
jgi:hypothetical protein